MTLGTLLASSKIRVLFLFVGILSALVIIKCINLNRLDSSSINQSLDNRVIHHYTNAPIHSTSHPPYVRPKSNGQSGYVLPLGYGGYQGRGVTGIVSIQCWIKSFDLPINIVEPLVNTSQFVGLPEGDWIKFNEIFNINLFNKLTQVEDRFAQLVTWDDFLKNAPRNVIFAKFNAGTPSHAKVEWETQEKEIYTNHRNCQTITTLNYFQDRGFCVVKVVNTMFQHNHPFTADDLYKVIFKNWKPEEVTLIVNGWSPLYFVPNPKLQDPLVCRKIHLEGHQFFPPSKRLLEAVQKYEYMFLKPSTSIAIMVRSEHFFRSLGNLRTNKTMFSKTCCHYQKASCKVSTWKDSCDCRRW